MVNKEIASTIINQLGGSRFVVMTGSRDFIAIENGVRMTLARNYSKANRLEIVLNGDDTYSMRFYNYQSPKFNSRTYQFCDSKETEIKEYEHIYFDQLQELFTNVTHMYTNLF